MKYTLRITNLRRRHRDQLEWTLTRGYGKDLVTEHYQTDFDGGNIYRVRADGTTDSLCMADFRTFGCSERRVRAMIRERFSQ